MGKTEQLGRKQGRNNSEGIWEWLGVCSTQFTRSHRTVFTAELRKKVIQVEPHNWYGAMYELGSKVWSSLVALVNLSNLDQHVIQVHKVLKAIKKRWEKKKEKAHKGTCWDHQKTNKANMCQGRETVQWANCLLWKHEDLCKKLGAAFYTVTPVLEGRQKQDNPGNLMTSLVKW